VIRRLQLYSLLPKLCCQSCPAVLRICVLVGVHLSGSIGSWCSSVSSSQWFAFLALTTLVSLTVSYATCRFSLVTGLCTCQNGWLDAKLCGIRKVWRPWVWGHCKWRVWLRFAEISSAQVLLMVNCSMTIAAQHAISININMMQKYQGYGACCISETQDWGWNLPWEICQSEFLGSIGCDTCALRYIVSKTCVQSILITSAWADLKHQLQLCFLCWKLDTENRCF